MEELDRVAQRASRKVLARRKGAGNRRHCSWGKRKQPKRKRNWCGNGKTR